MTYLTDGGEFFVKICRDLTERREAESERDVLLTRERLMRAEVEKASLLKDEFLATLSHELRNPLNLISLQAEIILRGNKGDAALMRAAKLIRQTVDTQSQLISDLLDTSRLQTGKFTLHPQLLPLTFVVADCLGAIRQEATSKQVSIDVDLTPEPLIVDADPVRVRQIAWNLLTNAVKFTPARGKVAVKLTREGDEARLEVSDNGAGIPPEVLPGIYDMFSQGEGGTTREHGGLGIGLALVKQMVEMHAGRIQAHSEGIGRGARFTVWLPLHKATELPRVISAPKGLPRAGPAIAEEPTDAGGVAGEADGALMGIRMLVVDDTPENAESLRVLLTLEGADVRIAASAREGLVMVDEFPFDAIISDIAMPEMDGHDFMLALRQKPRNAEAPSIALTGYDRPSDAAKARAAGFDEHIAKPADLTRLVAIIRRLTGAGKARDKD